MKKLLSLSILLWLAGCAGDGAPNNHVAGNWKHLGKINSDNINVFYDANSVSRNGNTATLRDQKVILNMQKADFSQTPRYKDAIAVWQFDCSHHTYRLSDLTLLNEQNQIISKHQYTAAQIPPAAIPNGSIVATQFTLACGKS